MTIYDIELVVDGCAFLEANGNLYEFMGNDKKGFMIFQSINDDYHFKAKYNDLITNSRFNIAQ